jgi:CTP:molybdopterin cytidylyltransferase MocA
MGKQKLLLPIDGQPMIRRVLAAASAWPVVVVAGDDVAPELGSTEVCIVRNATPERGMSHSLYLGNAVIPDGEPIAVLLGDLPDITPAAIETVVSAYDDTVDIVVPSCDEQLAHPVVFGPRARRKIVDLADGDTIDRLRDDPHLRRRTVVTDRCALHDIDTPVEYARRVGDQTTSDVFE